MSQHKDLPAGSRAWASEVDKYRARVEELEGIVRRMASELGLDYSNPTRGLNTGDIPASGKTLQLKLPSLRDLDIRDAVDGDLLTFDGKRGVWVARRHNTVQLPKVFEVGDPDSYYHPPTPPVEDGTWSSTTAFTNFAINPSFESGFVGWIITDDWPNDDYLNVAKGISSGGGGLSGDKSITVTLGATDQTNLNKMNWVSSPQLPVSEGSQGSFQISVRQITPRDGLGLNAYCGVFIYDSAGNVLGGENSLVTSDSLSDGGWHTVHVYPPNYAIYPGAAYMRMIVRLGSNWEGALIDNVDVELDCFAVSGLWEYFDGDSAPTSEFSFSWTAEPHASTSIASSARQINVPEIITLGEEFTVKGRGFPAGASVDVYESYWYAANSTVTVAPDGTFTTTLTIPANTDPDVGPVAGQTDTIEAYQSGSSFTPSVTVTYQ